jgi:3-hydroxyisobutyrate dehydrogenase
MGMRVAFLGLGRMGQRMAAHVVRAGHETRVWNRSPGRDHDLLALGATGADTLAEAVGDAEVVVMMLSGPASTDAVLHQVVTAAPAGALVVDATTIGPAAARAQGEAAASAGLRYVDAPVAGSLAPAHAGTLGSFVGGQPEDVREARTVIDLWSDTERVVHLGPVGTGNALKLVINMTIGIMAAGTGEALRLAGDLEVDRDRALVALAGSPVGWLLAQKGSAIAADDHEDVAFSLELLAKDLRLAVDAATRQLPVTRAALGHADAATGSGRAEQDYATLASWIEHG